MNTVPAETWQVSRKGRINRGDD